MYDNRLLTARETANYLGICMSTLRKWEERGKIISVKKPNSESKYYPQSEINKVMRFMSGWDKYYFYK